MEGFIVLLFGAVVLIGVGLMVLIALTRKSPKGLNQQQYRSKWLKIEGAVTDDESSLHLAVLNADKLLDTALKARGFRGDTMGERMKSARSTFRSNDAVWAAHKLRNKIAHEEISVSPKLAKQALAAFKEALKDVGAL